MKVAIAISSVLGLCIASPVNAQAFHGGSDAGASASVPAARPADRPHAAADRAPAKRKIEKVALHGAGKMSDEALISTNAGRGVLGDMDSIGPRRPKSGERDDHRSRGLGHAIDASFDPNGGLRYSRVALGTVARAEGLVVPLPVVEERPLRSISAASSEIATAVQGVALMAGSKGLLSVSGRLDDADVMVESDSVSHGRGASVGPLFDEGPQLTGAAKYGAGFAGAFGIPGLSYIGEIAPGSTIRVFVENSSGVETLGYLRAGYGEASFALRSGAVILCNTDILLQRLHLAPGTNEIEFTIPADADADVCLQVIQQDKAALGGWAMSKGLKLFL